MKRLIIILVWILLTISLFVVFCNCEASEKLFGLVPADKTGFIILFFIFAGILSSGMIIIDYLLNKNKNIVLNYLTTTNKIDFYTFLMYDIIKDSLFLSSHLKKHLGIENTSNITLREFFDFIYYNDRKKILRITSRLIKGVYEDAGSDNVFRIIDRYQKILYFRFEITPTLSKDGKVIKFLVDLQNVSELESVRNQSEEYKTKLQVVIDNLPMGLYIKEVGSFEYEEWNKRAEMLTGYPRSEVVGNTDKSFRTKSSAEFERIDDLSIVENDKIIEYEDIIMSPKKKKNIYFKTLKIKVSLPHKSSDIIIGVMNDITNLKEAEFELKASRQRLIEIVNLTKIGWI